MRLLNTVLNSTVRRSAHVQTVIGDVRPLLHIFITGAVATDPRFRGDRIDRHEVCGLTVRIQVTVEGGN